MSGVLVVVKTKNKQDGKTTTREHTIEWNSSESE